MEASKAAIALLGVCLLGGCGSYESAPSASSGADLSGAEVTTRFKGQTVLAKIEEGELGFDSQGLLVVTGVVLGRQVANNEPSRRWAELKTRSGRPLRTDCRILDHDATRNEFLVEGRVSRWEDVQLFISPGSVIHNATVDRSPVALRTPGGRYDLPFGQVVEIQESGGVRVKGYRN